MTSAFSLAGRRLRENGISVLPIAPNSKAPGAFTGSVWRLESKWSRFCDRLPTDLEMGVWEKWPDAGMGVALGASSGGLVCADIDTEDAAIAAAILAVLPPSPVRKRGRKGQALFFRASPKVVNRSYNVAKSRVLDLLAHGRQTVLPPTLHPDSGQPYAWLTPDTLENYSVADLPDLPDDIGDRLAAALAPFGYEPPLPLGQQGNAALDPAESPHRALNDAALANLDAWVPALQLFGCTRSGGHYRAVPHWRPSNSGRPLAKRAANVSIAPEGIKDFGDADKGYTPIDLVMAACGVDLDLAFRWLQEHVAPQKPILLNVTPPREVENPPKPIDKVGNLRFLGPLPAPPTYVEEAVDETPPGVVPERLCAPAGLLGEIVEWIVASAETPSPQLALGAAINLMGALCGRRWESPTRARTNFYSVGLAPTGYGKGHPRSCCITLAMASGFHKFLGAGDVKSDSGMRKMLESWPTRALYFDEFGGYVGKILDRRAAAHDRRMRDMLLELFSVANGVYLGSEGASEKAVMIQAPNMCLHGTSTPADFWKAFSTASAEDGLLPRFLIFDAGPGRPEIVTPTAAADAPPQELVRRLRQLMDVRPAGNLNSVGDCAVKPIRATWGDGAEEAYREMRMPLREEAMSEKGMREIVLSRVAEHVIKLALLNAVGCGPQAPVITVAGLQWARSVVDASSVALLTAIEGRVADSDRQSEYLLVLRMIREAGPHGISLMALNKIIRGRFDKRRTVDILDQLKAAGEVVDYIGSGANGGRPGARLRAIGAEDEAAA